MGLHASRFAPLALVVASLASGCASTLYIPTSAPHDPTPRLYEDPILATRVSGTRDLPCAHAVDAYRIAYAARGLGGRSSRPPNVYFDIAEGCGKRATYLEDCERIIPMPAGLSQEEAARRRQWTIDAGDARVPACKLTLVGVVMLDPNVPATPPPALAP